jgi:hypothetical protein
MRDSCHGPVVFDSDEQVPSIAIRQGNKRFTDIAAYVRRAARLDVPRTLSKCALEFAKVALA